MSYTAHRSRAFRDAGDLPLVVPRRSEGRIKTYPSATDARAWCVDTEERRQHILDLIRADREKCTLGKYVPIEVLIDTLLANKNADIANLRAQIDELQQLLDMYSKLDLTEDQKRMLEGMKSQMTKAGAGLGDISSKGGKGGKWGESEGDTDTDMEGYRSGKSGTESGGMTDDGETSSTATGKKDTRSTCSAVSRTNAEKAKAEAAAGGAGGAGGVIEKDAEIISLKNALAAKEAELEQQNKIARAAIEQLETLKDIVEERDHLKKKLEDSLHELNTLKTRVQDPCVKEIAALEAEIERLRTSGQLSPAEEAEVIRKEVEVLKKYCAKLSSIQEENNKLKSQVDKLRELSGVPANYQDETESSNDPNELKQKIKELKRKLAKFNEIIDERDRHKQRVQQLEKELLKYGGLPEEVELFKQRSQMLDDVMDERDNLQARLARMEGLDAEVAELKRRADRADRLERELQALHNEMGTVRRSSAAETEAMKSERNQSSKELDSIKAERDALRRQSQQMADAEGELERLKYKQRESEILLMDKCRGLEALKADRDMYKQKYEELLGLECECDMLKNQVEKYKHLDQERDSLVRQVRECECCIADQEDEIKKLVNHIDRISQGSNQQQDRMQKALCGMRAELEQKTSLIATSEEQLAGVQDQLKHTIADVSCETACLRAHIEELEHELDEAYFKLREKQIEVTDKDDLIRSLSSDRQGSAGRTRSSSFGQERSRSEDLCQGKSKSGSIQSDEHFEKMLTESKCAVRRVAEELGKHYEEWDCMQGKLLGEDRDQDRYRDRGQDQDQSRVEERGQDYDQALVEERGQDYDQALVEDRGQDYDQARVEDRGQDYDQAPVEDRGQDYDKTRVEDRSQDYDKTRVEDRGQDHDKARDQDLFSKYTEEKRTSLKLSNDVDDLKQRIRELEAELAKANATIAKLREGAGVSDRLTAENQALRRHSTEVQDVAKTQIEELVDHLKSAKDRIAELEALNAALKKGAGEGKAGVDNCDELKQQLQNMQQEKNKLESQVQQFQKDQSAGGAPDVGALRMELEKEAKLRREAEDKLRAAEERIANLTKQLNSMSDNMQEKVRKSSIAETEVEAELRKLKAENQQLKDNAKSTGDIAVRRTSQIEGEMAVISDKNKQLLKEKVALESENASLLQQLADLKKQLESLKSASGDSAELDALRKEKEALLAQVADQKKQINEMVQKINVPTAAATTGVDKDQLEKERREKEDLQNMIKNLQNQISTMEKAPAAAAPAAAPAPSDNSALNDAIAKLTKQLEQEQAKASACEDNLKKLQQEGSRAAPPSDDSAYLNEIAALKKKVETLEGEKAQLKSASGGDTSALTDELARLKERIKGLESENSQLKSAEPKSAAPGDTSALTDELAKLKEKMKNMESENSQLKSSATGDTSALTDELAKLREKINSLEKENTQLKSSAPGDTSAFTNQIATLNARIKELEDEIAMLKNRIKDLDSQNSQLAAAAAGDDTALLSQLNELKSRMKELEMENLDLKEKKSGVSAKDTGSEAITKKSSASIKMLENAMHLSDEDAAILQQMKDAYEDQIKNLQAELALQKKQCADTVDSLKAQYDRDVKNINNKHNDGIAKLQGSHEEILKDVGREHEQEVENLRTELRNSKGEIQALHKEYSKTSSGAGRGSLSIKTVENVSINPKTSGEIVTKKGICTCGTAALKRILQKILKYGIESLEYGELRTLHDKTRDATSALLRKSPPQIESMPKSRSPPLSITSQDSPLMKRLSDGSEEGDIVKKQKHAQNKVGALQIAVKMEQERLEELKRNLEMEKQRNNELMLKLGAQSRAVSTLQNERESLRRKSSYNEDKVQELSKNAERERERVKLLEEELRQNKEKQRRDSETLEGVRSQLRMSLQSENMLKAQLGPPTATRKGPQEPDPPCICDEATSTSRPPPQPPRQRQERVQYESPGRGSKRNDPSCCCECGTSSTRPPPPPQPRKERVEYESRNSFYTELSMQDVKNKRNFMHHCCTKCDRPRPSGSNRNKPPKDSDNDD